MRVHAASVNPADWHFLRGAPYIARMQFGLGKPKDRVLGCDVAGRVEAVGKNVTMLKPADEVFGSPFMHGLGAFADGMYLGVSCTETGQPLVRAGGCRAGGRLDGPARSARPRTDRARGTRC